MEGFDEFFRRNNPDLAALAADVPKIHKPGEDRERGGKRFLHMYPDYGTALFWDGEARCCGGFKNLTIYDDNGKEETTVSLESIPELEGWFWEWERYSLWRTEYDDAAWEDWKARGYALARRVAALLPPNVEFFYLWETDRLWKVDPRDAEDGGLFNYGNPKRVDCYR